MDEIYTVLGHRKVDFDTDDGKHISGFSVFLSVPRDGVTGVATEKFFISMDKFRSSPFKPNDRVRISFNRYGKVDRIAVVE